MIFISSEKVYDTFYDRFIVTVVLSVTVFQIWLVLLKIVAKPLQIKTWFLSTACRKSSVPHPMVPRPIFYDLPFSYNTSVTDDRQTYDTLCHRRSTT